MAAPTKDELSLKNPAMRRRFIIACSLLAVMTFLFYLADEYATPRYIEYELSSPSSFNLPDNALFIYLGFEDSTNQIKFMGYNDSGRGFGNIQSINYTLGMNCTIHTFDPDPLKQVMGKTTFEQHYYTITNVTIYPNHNIYFLAWKQ